MSHVTHRSSPEVVLKEKIARAKQDETFVIFHEKIFPRIAINYWIKWLILGEIFGGAAFLAVLFSKGTMAWIGQLALMYSFVFMIAGAAPIWVKKQLEILLPNLIDFIDLPEQQTRTWFESKLKKIYHPLGMGLSGLIISTLAMFSFIFQTKWYTSPVVWWGTFQGDLTVTIVVSLLVFLAGVTVYIAVQIAMMVMALPRLPLKLTIYQNPLTGISAIGAVLQKVTLLGSVYLGLIAITAVFLSPFSKQMDWLISIWLGFAGLILMLFFIVPQYSIHVAMSKAKSQKLRVFTHHLSESLDRCIDCPSSEEVAQVKELFEIYNHLLEMPEWPFDVKSIISLVTVIILPILLSIIQKIIAP